MRKKESTTKRLDLSPQVVEAAKVAFAKSTGRYTEEIDLEEVYFRDVLDMALGKFLPTITEGLKKAGFKKRVNTYRQRPVSIKSWDELDDIVEAHDLPKVRIVRAALELLAQSGGEDV